LYIADGTFAGCAKLNSITIPDRVTGIGQSAFDQCIGLTSVTIGNSVTNIGYEAFYSCTNLISVIFGKSVVTIGAGAFVACTNLSRLTFKGNAPTLLGNQVWSSWALESGQNKTVYYFAGTTGWGATFGGLTTVQLTTPTVQSLVFNVNGNAQLSWSAMHGSVYEIQSTDSLDNPFVTRSIQTASNTVETWNEPNSSIPSKRFYRVNIRLP
jgi:hypothetical protein